MAQNGQPMQPGELAFCADVELTNECLEAVFGTTIMAKQNWKDLLTKCGIEPGEGDEKYLKTTLLAQMKRCTNIYSRVDSDFFVKTYKLASPPSSATGDAKASFASLHKFFSNEEFVAKTNAIMAAMTVNAKIQATIDKTSALLKNPSRQNSVNEMVALFKDGDTYYQDIVTKIEGLALVLNGNVKNKTPFLCVMLYMFHIASLKEGIAVTLNDDLLETGDINETDMDFAFKKIPSALDARQFITVNRFTKYRKQCDKACFLFHGVGTGKTMTSTTIALSHLTDDNKFSTTIDNADKKPLQVLVVCPQGLFFGSFQGDADKLSIYTYNRTVYTSSYEKDGKTYDYQFEQFDACVKVDDTSYYKIRFTGFDYLNLFNKDYALDKLGDNNYDVLICDEAHKIITEKLRPGSQIGYDIAFRGSGTVKQGDLIEVPRRGTVTKKDPTVCAINDVRFVNFVKDKISKQSIFLTGTPIQKTPYDIVSILKFLNIKGINDSNNKKLCDDVNKDAPINSKYYFNRLDSEGNSIMNAAEIISNRIYSKKKYSAYEFLPAGFAQLYLAFQNLSGATVEDLEADLNEGNEPNWFVRYVGHYAPVLLPSGTQKDLDVADLLKQMKEIQALPGSINKITADIPELVDIGRTFQNTLKDDKDFDKKARALADAAAKSIKENLKKESGEFKENVSKQLKKTLETQFPDLAKTTIDAAGNVKTIYEKLADNENGPFSKLISLVDDNKATWEETQQGFKKSMSNIYKETLIAIEKEAREKQNELNGAEAAANAAPTGPLTRISSAPTGPPPPIPSTTTATTALPGPSNYILPGATDLPRIPSGRGPPPAPPANGGKYLNRKNRGGMRGGAEEEKQALVKYVGELPEQSLTLKTEMGQILSNFDGSTLIDTTPVMQIIVKDTGIPEENITKTLSYLYDCLNGKVPYEKAVEVLGNEKVVTMLNPLLGPNWVFLENPSSRTSTEITLGGKKRKQTIRKKYLKKSKTRKNKYVGGVLSITDGRDNNSELVMQNISNEVFVKEIPVLLGLQLYNFGTTLDEQLEYFTEKTLQLFAPNKNSTSPINISNDIETIKYAETLLTTYFSLYGFKQDNQSTADVEELDDSQDGGAPPGKIKTLLFFMGGIGEDFWALFKAGEKSAIDIKGIIWKIIQRVTIFVSSFIYTRDISTAGPIGAIGAITPEMFRLTIFISKIVMNVISYAIEQKLGEFNLDGMIENIMPFISIYNYDYINTAIDNKQFFEGLLESTPQFKLSETVNENGTTNAFPDKFIENIYFPFTQQQVREIHSLENTVLKNLFATGNVNLSKENNAKLSYQLNESLNNLSCGIEGLDKAVKDALLANYIAYFKKPSAEEEEEALGFLTKKQDDYKKNGEFNTFWQLGPAVNISLDKFKFENINIAKFADNKRKPINISGNFVDFRKDELAVGVEKSPSYLREDEIVTQNISTINNTYFNTLRTELRANARDIQTQVKFLQEKPYEKPPYKSGTQTKFENVLELLKIIRAGVIFQGEATEVSRFNEKNMFDSKSQFVYHPHYALGSKFQLATRVVQSVEYYLPVIYPPTHDVMYGFCKFLDEKKYKYIWLNDKLDPFNLDAQLKFGTIFTFPIRPYGDAGDNNPICIVLSPPHKEGFSFTFNPAIISLGLSETAGDEEQIYGRVLRKYGKEAFEGKYGKKIYQYFSGGNKDTVTLPTLTSLYSLDIKTVFRGMYDSRGYSKTTAGGSSLGSVADSIWLSVFQGYDGLQYNTWVSSDTSRKALATSANSNATEEKKQEFFDENFPILDLADELQLKLLYNVKYVSLEFFKKIAIKENAKLQPSFGARINPLNLWYGVQKPPFHPIDVQEMITVAVDRIPEKNEEMRKTVKNSLKYCMENLNGDPKLPDFKLYNGDALNIKSALVCLQKGIACPQPPPVGGNKKHKTTKRRNAYKKNKRTRKYKK